MCSEYYYVHLFRNIYFNFIFIFSENVLDSDEGLNEFYINEEISVTNR
jgi:hypothetical protein